AVVVLLVQVVRRYRVARWTVGLPGLALLLGGGFVLRDAVAGVVRMLGAGLVAHGDGLVLSLLLLATGALWAAVGAQTLAGTSALVRLAWLTPWPQLGFDVDLSTRVWGLTLSSGAWLGVVLTLGLIRPWGEVFPRWVPGLAGRRVPVAAAAVPGGLVAVMLLF